MSWPKEANRLELATSAIPFRSRTSSTESAKLGSWGHSTGSRRQLVEQGLRLLEVRRVKALGEPAVDRPEEVRRSDAVAASSPQPGEVGGGTQFERARSLRTCHVQGSHITDLCLSRTVSKQP